MWHSLDRSEWCKDRAALLLSTELVKLLVEAPGPGSWLGQHCACTVPPTATSFHRRACVDRGPAPARTGSVTGLHIERLGRTSQPSTISYLDAGVVYIGSACGDSQLIRWVATCVWHDGLHTLWCGGERGLA